MKQGMIKRLWAYLRRRRLLLWGGLLCAVCYVPLGLLGPVFIGRAIDGIVGVGDVDFQAIGVNVALLLATAAVGAALQWVMLYCTRKISAEAAQEIRQQAFDSMSVSPLSRIDTHPHGDMVSRLVNDTDAVAEGLLQAMSQLLPGVVTILTTLVMMLVMNWLIALIVIVLTPASLLFARVLAGRGARMFRAQSSAQGALSAQVNETVRQQPLVRAFGYEAQSAEEFAQNSDAYFTANFKATLYSSIINPGSRFINAIAYAAVGVVGAIMAIGGGITVGGLSAFLTYANQYTRPFNEVSAVATQMQAALAAAERLFEMIDWAPEAPDPEDAAAPRHSDGNVAARAVWFSYDKNRELIKDLDFDVSGGTRVALVGPTGSGKTTIINLLMRFYEVDRGTVTVDGTPGRAIRRDALRRLYGMVLQDTWLKQASVRENIAYGCPDASEEDVKAAAKSAMAHRFIMQLPQGYDTVLASGGGDLSAGQRQLLCIARIMLAQPDILILDEATSSIDTRTEMLIQRALEKLMAGRTSFIVAHRLSTIESADLILVMDAGRIVERGNHIQLLQKNGFYAKLYYSQFEAEIE